MKLERVIQKPLACGLSGMIAMLACVAGAMLAAGCATAAWTFRALESNASGSYVDRMAMFAVGQASLRPPGPGNEAIQTAQDQIQRALVRDGTASSSEIMINIFTSLGGVCSTNATINSCTLDRRVVGEGCTPQGCSRGITQWKTIITWKLANGPVQPTVRISGTDQRIP